jgi:hypothetical protein
MLALKRAAASLGGQEFFDFLKKAQGFSGTGLAGAPKGPVTWPGPTLGTDPVKPFLELADGAAGAASKLDDFKGGLTDTIGAFLDPTQIGSNLASMGIGALISGGMGILGGLFGEQESAASRALREALDENRRALERASATIAQAFVGTTAGSTQVDLITALRAFLSEGPGGGTMVKFDLDKLEAELKKLGLSLDDLEAATQDLGMEFVATWVGIVQLVKALEAKSTADLVGTMSGQLSFMGREFGLLDIEDTSEKLQSTLATLLNFVSGDLKDALLAVDWEAPDEFLKAMLASFRAGTFDVGQLDKISPEEFLNVISQLESFGDELAGATSELSQFGNSLRNAPTGFKVALGRFNATTPEVQTYRTDPPGGGGPVFTGPIIIQEAHKSGAELYREIEVEATRRAARGGVGALQL